jgi:signal transduction histidine kinase
VAHGDIVRVAAELLTATVITAYRFTVGWYSARFFALAASCTVLTVLLTETILLYARLANAVTALRRERANRLMSLDAATSAMAHEIRQPLTVISAEGSAALDWLIKTPPDFDEVSHSVATMISASFQVDKIIASVRALFGERFEEEELEQLADFLGRLPQTNTQVECG